MIRLDHVSKSYEVGKPALEDVTIHIDPGEFVFIVGDSGSGKSTLIRLLLKELEPTKGKIYINGQDLKKVTHKKIPMYRRNVGVVFQNFRLLPDRNVYENVAFALEVTGVDSKQIRKRVIDVLDKVGLKHKAKEYPDKLSGGEQQRVAIARAVVNLPKILICDEPTGNLDPKISMEIMEILEKINKEYDTTILMVTHDLDIVKKMKKRVIALKEGRVVKDYKAGEFVSEKL